MRTPNGFEQACNVQAAGDADSQVNVAASLTNAGSDKQQLAPMAAQTGANTGRTPKEMSVDSGCCSEVNLAEP